MATQELNTAANPFAGIISQVTSVPQPQRADKLLTSITHEMEQSSSSLVQQMGQQLDQIKAQLVKALQQA